MDPHCVDTQWTHIWVPTQPLGLLTAGGLAAAEGLDVAERSLDSLHKVRLGGREGVRERKRERERDGEREEGEERNEAAPCRSVMSEGVGGVWVHYAERPEV